MKGSRSAVRIFLLPIVSIIVIQSSSRAQTFIHPGIDQQGKDLQYMKKKVLAGEQPWKGAFDRLKAAADTPFIATAHTHVLRGAYGRPNIGGDDLSKSANMAYNYALVWYITNDKAYAQKAINILNNWSPVLWDLDYNDAKLLAAWTGHVLCNAAEILRYTNTGWQQKDIGAFTHMLNTVYFPLMRPYYPQANGNWDGAIIHSLIAIAVFTDNRPLFDNAVNHFKYAPVNGSILKYIYPDGQCQESPRDQGHVQLGLGEFAGAAQVAFTQGVDLFSIAGNRIALGYEYTAGFLQGEHPHCYCNISPRATALRDDYEYVYRHYTAQGIELPFTKKAADAVRDKASRSVLSSVRAPLAGKPVAKGIPKGSTVAEIAGAHALPVVIPGMEPGFIAVSRGESVQKAVDDAAGTGKWVVLDTGIHVLPATLKIPSGVILAGKGISTVLFLDPASGSRETIINADSTMHDVVIRDLVIEAGSRTDPGTDPNTYRSFKGGYNRGGVLFRSGRNAALQHISLINCTVRNATYSGVSISGASDITIDRCDFNENGGSNVPPGPKLVHNLLLAHCKNVKVNSSRLVTSPAGSGIALDHCSNVSVSDCEIARNGYYGVLLAESNGVSITGNLVEANDASGVMAEFLSNGNKQVHISNNRIQYNNGYGVESYATKNSTLSDNFYEGNNSKLSQQKITLEKKILMQP